MNSTPRLKFQWLPKIKYRTGTITLSTSIKEMKFDNGKN